MQNKKIVYEEDKVDNPIHSKIIIYKKTSEIPKGSKEVKTWVLILFIGFILLLVTILIAALVTFISRRRPGLYREDCVRRSCETELGLKCINSVCDCESDEYYLKGCLPKKSIGENCHRSIDQCVSGLICFNGKCGCHRNSTWNGKKCVKKGTYGENCEQTNCNDNLLLTCDSKTKICSCGPSLRFWSGHACVNKRTFNEKCVKTSDCLEDRRLSCVKGFCMCTEYFKIES